MGSERQILRSRLAAAVKYGREAEAEEIRAVLRVANIKRSIEELMDGAPPMTRTQMFEVRRVLEAHTQPVEARRPRTPTTHDAVTAEDDVERTTA